MLSSEVYDLKNNVVQDSTINYNTDSNLIGKYDDFAMYRRLGVWNKIYKKELIQDIPFIKGYAEDLNFTYKVLDKAKKIHITKKNVYIYRKCVANSITNKEYTENNIVEMVKQFNNVYEHITDSHLAFNYWDSPQFYPDRILLWNDIYNISNLYYNRKIVKQYNNIMLNTLSLTTQKNILIISQWAYRSELLNLYNNIKEEGVYLLIHPKDTFKYPLDKNIIKSFNNQKELEKAKLVLGYNSSMLINAKSLGIEVITFDKNFGYQCSVKCTEIKDFKLSKWMFKETQKIKRPINFITPLEKKVIKFKK